MKVLLKRNWFTPFGRFKKSATKKGPPVEIPDSLRGRLPSDAEVVDDESVVIADNGAKIVTLADAAEAEGMDVARVAAEAQAQVHEDAGMPMRKNIIQQVRANAILFQKELDAENAKAMPATAAEPVKRGPGRPKKGT